MSKDHFIKIRVTSADKLAFEAASKSQGKTASEILRNTVLRTIKRHSRDGGDAQHATSDGGENG